MEGLIITEEQFDLILIKYKQLKTEIDQKEIVVKKIIENGNEMLKNSSTSINYISEFASKMVNFNSKWSNLKKMVDFKIKELNQLEEFINELRRKKLIKII